MRTRFAPSPTGYLHLGHALAASEAFGFAKVHGGECGLRIEDIDYTRCKAEYTQAIYDDLQLKRGERPAWRLSLTRARDILGSEFEQLDFEENGEHVAPAPFGDEVLARRDIGLSYHLCAVQDDALQS